MERLIIKSESHGCVTITSWDVERLAKSIRKGVEVNFVSKGSWHHADTQASPVDEVIG
jgi:hypothetical protein